MRSPVSSGAAAPQLVGAAHTDLRSSAAPVAVRTPAAWRGSLGLRSLAGFSSIQYRRAAMRVHRRARATTGLVVLALLLGSLWAGALGGSSAGSPADRLAPSRSLVVVRAAVLPDRAPALRPSAERPEPGSPLLLGMLLAALAAAFTLSPRRPRLDLGLLVPLVRPAQSEARAPPDLQPV